jgi:hypothetical protein
MMQHLHDIHGLIERLFIGVLSPCPSTRHDPEDEFHKTHGVHADCLVDMIPGIVRGNVWYCECPLCSSAATHSETGMFHLFAAQHTLTPVELDGNVYTLICEPCRRGSHADEFFNVSLEHTYNLFGGCDCGHYNAAMDFDGHVAEDAHEFAEDGYCIVCGEFDPHFEPEEPE